MIMISIIQRRKMAKEGKKLPENKLFLSIAPLILILCGFYLSVTNVNAQDPIPAKFDGFVYKGEQEQVHEDSIIIEAFFDPLCPDSRDAWPPLKQALEYYSHRVSLTVHPFPLPYHDNAYVACRALHIANNLNKSTTYPLLELFFKYQEKYYNQPTFKMSRASIVDQVTELVLKAVGNSSLSAIQSGFANRQTDLITRVSFKYGCSRGVLGTPYFFVNGFPLPDAGSPLDYNKWRSIIDPLLNQQRSTRVEPLHFFL